ncbi:hypothetical protein [[Mycoplasma] testudinis]|uniref:hypothetical protein n=1 Tax=[Mycoplasma] testudinis TaxID=33924 RepID=UPI0004860EB0|nr:hypothetical protein [[Mycoplasma] testudinis]
MNSRCCWDESFKKKVKQYVAYHNFYRYHTKIINKYDDRFLKYIIQINFVKRLNEIDFKAKTYLRSTTGHSEHLSWEKNYGSKD